MKNNTKIQQSEYQNIINRYNNGETVTQIARDYGVNNSCIYKIFDKTGTKTTNIKPKGRYRAIPKEYHKEIIQKYQNGRYIKYLAKDYGVAKNTIKKILVDNGIEIKRFIRQSQFSKSEVDHIYDLYLQGDTLDSLGEKYNVDPTEISFLFNKYNYQRRSYSHARRKYNLNENYFDNIDTQNKAYFLGLLYADGCNMTNRNVVTISLKESDKHILESLQQELETDQPLHFIDMKKKNPNFSNQYQLRICNKNISEMLSKHGMVSAKSLILEFPSWLGETLVSHFIRGYFDGDGHVSGLSHTYVANLVGTEQFCLVVQNILQRQGINAKISYGPNKETTTRYLRLNNKADCKTFLDYIYNDAELYLKRKHDIYLDKYKNL